MSDSHTDRSADKGNILQAGDSGGAAKRENGAPAAAGGAGTGKPAMTLPEVNHFIHKHFPQIGPDSDMVVEAVGDGTARLRMLYKDKHLRPGGTISGPTMFALADVAIYIAILGSIGVGSDPDNAHKSAGAQTVTTHLGINFLRKPEPGDLIAEAQLLKTGQRLVVGEARLHSDGSDAPVAHAVGTYSIPPVRQ